MNYPAFIDRSKLVFKGKRFDIYRKQVEDKNHRPHDYEAIIHPGGAVVLPVLNDNEIVMIRNRRVAVGEDLWELPAGFLEINEEPIVTAGRELLEESGYSAGRIKHALSFYTSPGMTNELIHGYIAWDLTLNEQQLEPGEWITVEVLHNDIILEMLRTGVIKDSKTALLLLFYFYFGKNIDNK